MKKSIKSALLSGAAIALFAGAAHAADSPAPMMSWTGLYIGVGGGGAYNFADIDAGGYGFVNGDDTGNCGPFTDDASGTEFGGGCFGGDNSFEALSYAQIGDGVDFAIEDPADSDFTNGINEFLNEFLGGGNSDNGAAQAFGLGKIGADWQVGSNFVIGLAADFRFGSSTIEESSSAAIGGGGEDGAVGVGELDAKVEVENSWSVGGRAGYLPAENILLYMSGGYTSAKVTLETSFDSYVEWDARDSSGEVGYGMSSSDSKWLNGFYVGGGVDMMLTDHIMAGVEYRYADLGSIDTKVQYLDCCNWTAGGGVGGEASLTSHSITATISYKFGLGL